MTKRWIEAKLGPLSASDLHWIDMFVARLEYAMKHLKQSRDRVKFARERAFDVARVR